MDRVATTLKARQPMRPGQFVAWHHQFIFGTQIADISEKLNRQPMYTLFRKIPGSSDHTQCRRNEFESGGTGPERKWEAPIPREAPEKHFLVVPLHFLALKVQLVAFMKRFRDGQYSLVSFFFAVLLLAVPPMPSHF